jgi:hydroxypyruvate reductase
VHSILRGAVDAVEPRRLVRSALSRGTIDLPRTTLFLVAAGKAAWPMACALELEHGNPARAWQAGVVAGPQLGRDPLPPRLEWFDAAHPSPNAASEAAGRRALALAAESRTDGTLIVLLSGGASSMLAVPAAALSLADKIATSSALMNAGVPIADLNCVRKHLSAVKGGRLAATARRTITWAISDVNGPIADDPAVIGSGPTVADPSTSMEALEIVRRSGVGAELPASVMAHLEKGTDETPKPGDPRLRDSLYTVMANRHLAMDGAARIARGLGYDVQVIQQATSGEARDAGLAFASSALDEGPVHGRATSRPRCIIASGETTVRVRGRGRGGRNQEFALSAVPVLASLMPWNRAAVLASAGTDGIDGPTDAAGAIADTSSGERALGGGVRWDAALADNGAYDFFEPLGDLIVWGPTGTNVGDVHVLLVETGRETGGRR